jgi:hypothetical protein
MPDEFMETLRALLDEVEDARPCCGEKGVSLSSRDSSMATARHICGVGVCQ